MAIVKKTTHLGLLSSSKTEPISTLSSMPPQMEHGFCGLSIPFAQHQFQTAKSQGRADEFP